MMTAHGESVNLTIEHVPYTLPLPPASAQTFLQKQNFSALVVADHSESYSNKYVDIFQMHVDSMSSFA